MDQLTFKHPFSRVIPLLACCSLGWLAYSRYTGKQQPTQRALPDSKSVTGSVELPAQATLDKLSLDILLEIMQYLEWHELLKLRQVSFSLNTATRERVLWHAFIRSSSSRFALTKAIWSCSSQELEDAFLRVKKVDQRWVNPERGPPPHVRQLPELGCLDPHNCMILPGGRWLLKLEDNTGLFYADLNSVDIQWHTLVPPHPEFKLSYRLPWAKIHHVVDINCDAEYLTFNVAIVTTLHWTVDVGKMPARFDIWQCTPEFGEHGDEKALTATLLSTFEEWEIGVLPSKVSLRGDFIACGCTDNQDRIIVTNWKEARGRGNGFSRFVFPYMRGELEELFILPNERLLYQSYGRQTSWNITTWENMPPTTDPFAKSSPGAITPVVTYVDPPFCVESACLPFIHNHGITYVAYSTIGSRIICCSLPIPDDDSSPSLTMQVKTLFKSHLPERLAHSCTANRVLVRSNDKGLVTGTYNVDQKGHLAALNLFEWTGVLPFIPVESTMLDDVTGRCILASEQPENFLVDFCI